MGYITTYRGQSLWCPEGTRIALNCTQSLFCDRISLQHRLNERLPAQSDDPREVAFLYEERQQPPIWTGAGSELEDYSAPEYNRAGLEDKAVP
jgi:hypothetical protein